MAVLFASYPPWIFPFLYPCTINFTGSPPHATCLWLKAAASPVLGVRQQVPPRAVWSRRFSPQRDAGDLPRVYSGAGEEERRGAATPTQTRGKWQMTLSLCDLRGFLLTYLEVFCWVLRNGLWLGPIRPISTLHLWYPSAEPLPAFRALTPAWQDAEAQRRLQRGPGGRWARMQGMHSRG